MNRGSQSPLQEGQELIGILDTDDELVEDADENQDDDVVATRHDDDPATAPWDQLIAAVDREFLPHETATPWAAARSRAK
jgi:hypothetical protein